MFVVKIYYPALLAMVIQVLTLRKIIYGFLYSFLRWAAKILRSHCEFYLLTLILEFEIMNGQNYECREIQTQGGQS